MRLTGDPQKLRKILEKSFNFSFFERFFHGDRWVFALSSYGKMVFNS